MAIQFENNVVAGVVLIRDSIQSQNFGVDDEGVVTGWQINSDGSSSFTSATIGGANWGINDDGVGSFSDVNVENDLMIDGVSLLGALDAIPKGLVAYGDSVSRNVTGTQWTVDSAAFSASTLVAEFGMGPLRADRYYRLVVRWQETFTVATDNFRVTIRYTTDGTAPTTASSILDGSEMNISAAVGATGGGQILHAIYSPAVDYDVVRMALNIARATGTGTTSVELLDPNTAMQWSLEDLGPQTTAISGGALSQKSKSAGTPDPDPVSTYVKTYSANWSRSWNNGGSAVYTTNGILGQGASPATASSGNRVSWIGFDFAAIQSALSGATVKKVEVFLYFEHWYNNAGGTAVIGTHSSTATSAPAFNAALDDQDRLRVANWAADSGKWVNLTATVGNDFKTGAATGIVLGQGPTTNQLYYGKARGNTQASEPQLRITYTK